MKNKCKECGCVTKQTNGYCFTCEGIVAMIKQIEIAISNRQPMLGKKRKLEILSYKISISE